ncbi:hypothetical protein COB55_01905 [Candidatus Wolfebacteria bacterium]|nr:MAG: hypothetical protein COB55_01905 [Candidatus Wolfebacteria bacterium]
MLYVYAFIGGLIPALLWLWFWLQEDRLHPEPKRYLFFTFLGGMIAVVMVLPVEAFIFKRLGLGLSTIALWAFFEELFKFGAAYLIAIRYRVNDEPIDAVIYLITAALGFAALENMFFLLDPLQSNQLVHTVVTGNLRFLGASILHTLSSATIGIVMAYAFFKNKLSKRVVIVIGLILATVLHTLFNFFIIQNKGAQTFLVFFGVWIAVIALILIFEKVKRIHK